MFVENIFLSMKSILLLKKHDNQSLMCYGKMGPSNFGSTMKKNRLKNNNSKNNINTINIQGGHKVPLCYIQCKSLSQSSRYATMTPNFSSVCSQAVSSLSLLIQLSSSESSPECLH